MEKLVEDIISKIMGSKTLSSEITENLIAKANQEVLGISDVVKREKSLKDLALALGKSGYYMHAIAEAQRIEGLEFRFYVFSALVSQMASNGAFYSAQELTLQIKDQAYREDAIGYLMRAYQFQKKHDEAKLFIVRLQSPKDRAFARKCLQIEVNNSP
jgi:hypothetical protein